MMSGKQPNIVFITPDQWRYDAMGSIQGSQVYTPNTDALRARGFQFSTTYCDSPVCQSSRASLVTGRHPRDHGLRDNHLTPWSGRKHFPWPDAHWTLPQRMRDAGYWTGLAGKMHFDLPPGPYSPDRKDVTESAKAAADKVRQKFDETNDLRDTVPWIQRYGFDFVAEELDKTTLLSGTITNYTAFLRERGLYDLWYRHHAAQSPTQPGIFTLSPEPLEPQDTLDAYVGRQARNFLQQRPEDQPFFLWMAPVGPHPPYDAPEAYAARYRGLGASRQFTTPPPLPDNAYGEFIGWNIKGRTLAGAGDDIKARAVEQYYANCTQVDAVIGGVVDELERLGLRGNTWIIINSDHGEMLGDHGFFGKSIFYHAAARVPGIVVPPTGTDDRAGGENATPVQGLDLTATILDIGNASLEGHAGRSLLPAFRGEAEPEGAVIAEIADFAMLATEKWKLVVERNTLTPQQLFDLQEDPEESTDLQNTPEGRKITAELIAEHIAPFYAQSPQSDTFG